MDRNIFRYILRHSARSQLLILAMTVASFPFLYATLELPKLIINDALSGQGRTGCTACSSARSTICSCCAGCSWSSS